MTLPVEEHLTGSLGLKAGVGLALPCQVRTAWIQAGGSDLGHGMGAAGEAWSHFGGHLLHCSLTERNRNKINLLHSCDDYGRYLCLYMQ